MAKVLAHLRGFWDRSVCHWFLLEQTAQARLEAGNPADALATVEHGIADDPCNERLARIAMRAEVALGLRNQIIARHEQLGRDLAQQLGLQPDHQTRILYRQLLGQDSAQPSEQPLRLA